jgi:hypothetical protein
MDPNNTPAPQEASEQPKVNSMAAFLYGGDEDTSADVPDAQATPADGSPESLAALARAAQTQVDPPTIITPAQEAEILGTQTPAPVSPPAQSTPIVVPVAQQQPMQLVVPVQQVSQQQPVQAQAPVQQQAPPSQEEIQRQLNIYNLTEADYDAVFDTEDKAESIRALNEVLQKAVRQAVTMSNVLIQEQTTRLQQTVQPYMQFADEQRSTGLHQAFYSRHQDLQAAQPVVDAVLKQFQSQGVKFQTPELLFDAVAQNTKAYLQQMQQLGQTVAPTAQGQVLTQGAPATGKPRMAALPSGGQGGAGAGGGKSGKVSTAQALFG